MASELLQRDDIQALILRAYTELRDVAYVFLEIADPAQFRLWLAQVTRHVTTGDQRPEDQGRHLHGCAFNIAFTRHGLRKLAVNPDGVDGYDGFGLEFKEGLVTQQRSRFLGDVGTNDPWLWQWGGRAGETSEARIDCLCLIFGNEADVFSAWAALQLDPRAASERHVIVGYLSNDGKEHFGFRDGISQPIIRFTKRDYDTTLPRDRALHVVEAGEFILGYENENFVMPVSPAVNGRRDPQNRLGPLVRRSRWGRSQQVGNLKDFGRNGTYLVLRQIRQYVGRFRQFAHDTAGADAHAQHLLQARMIGRWRSGAPLTEHPDNDPYPGRAPGSLNDFRFDPLDRNTFRCPAGAHIRRGNPRDATSEIDGQARAVKRVNSHRLIRRGRLYGPRVANGPQDNAAIDGVDRGLMFLCLNTDIRRQFEFVQQTWINNTKFGGLIDEVDPLVGQGGCFTVQRPEGNEHVHNLPAFVTVVGGGYFFMPGIQALHCLADA